MKTYKTCTVPETLNTSPHRAHKDDDPQFNECMKHATSPDCMKTLSCVSCLFDDCNLEEFKEYCDAQQGDCLEEAIVANAKVQPHQAH